jgi:Leucine-rich repeat (LRR) protein
LVFLPTRGPYLSQSDILASLFRAAEGGKWKDQRGWRELIKSKRVSDQTPAHLIPVAGAGATAGLQYLHQQQQQQQQQMSHRYLLSGLQGVTCDENSGEVLRIQLCSNNLKGMTRALCQCNYCSRCKMFHFSLCAAGQLPTGLGQLASLTHLVLSDNHLGGKETARCETCSSLNSLSPSVLPGALPASLGLLVNLENLHLDGNEFEGEIPKALKSLERLVVLKLEKNRLTGRLPPHVLVLCKYIKCLCLATTGAIPAVLGGLHRLRRLDLSHNALTGSIPPRITQLASLQELLLNDNQLSGCIPEAVGQLTNLTTLHLQANCLQGERSLFSV